MKVPKILIAVVITTAVAAAAFFFPRYNKLSLKPIVIDYESCRLAGGIMLETYPAQCRTGSQNFTQEIGNELDLHDLILISNPRPNQTISSPLIVRGTARGTWFFEASFPIKLVDERGKTIAESHAQAQGEWMTEDFVPYEGKLIFKTDAKKGKLILTKANPSDLPQNAQQLEVPVVFE